MNDKTAIISNGLEGSSVTYRIDLIQTPLDIMKLLLKDTDLAATFTTDPETRQQFIDGTFDRYSSRFAIILPSGSQHVLEWDVSLELQVPKELQQHDELEFIVTMAGIVGKSR
jgi:hypothetical protein